jgi:hypothetical protein
MGVRLVGIAERMASSDFGGKHEDGERIGSDCTGVIG